ncbi:hydrogenase maturation nickel metallochaperone HypA [Eubacteriaceae bacterium ES3]|nr:hydrogenase maturation nickel metallochaperone HypA [Eubacteriaceae bacterium ES3]
MHELGIVKHIIKNVQSAAENEDVTKVYSVTLEVGQVSAILPDIIQSCWKWSTDKIDLLRGAELICEEIQAVTICNACGEQYETLEHGKICPHCSSEDTVLLRGREVNIKELQVA